MFLFRSDKGGRKQKAVIVRLRPAAGETPAVLKTGCSTRWYTIYHEDARRECATGTDPRRAAAGYQFQLREGGVCGAEAGDYGDGHLWPSRGDPARRAAAVGGARGQPDADPRGDDAARTRGVRPHPAAPRH